MGPSYVASDFRCDISSRVQYVEALDTQPKPAHFVKWKSGKILAEKRYESKNAETGNGQDLGRRTLK